MKTILYNPIFINPQAYYVFPRLTRYLQPDNESTAEPANYIGTIEVKVIAYGDTTLKRTYTNTDSIDLSEFKNTWIRISLFTKVGSCVLGEWKIGNMESDLPYIDPEVLASLKAVVIVGNKTNNDSDRAIVKNLVDADNPFVISNAAYTEGSGYADKDSPYYGAFVTDGVDDLITSTKTMQEMLGESTEFTAVSMIHLISPGQDVGGVAYTNYIRTSDNYWTSNRVSNIDKTGIYGYSFKQGTPTVINNILGDKNDYTVEKADDVSEMFKAKFSVEGFEHVTNGAVHVSSVAWYWTIIANKVLTTDQINQVIAYFNLDRTLRPDILCNTIKQGITNENHAEFGDKLIDYSGNGRDIQLNNIAWKGDSGIGKYNYTYDNRIKTYNQCPANGYATLINPNIQAVNGDLSFTISGSYKETVIVELGEEQADGKFIFTNYRNGTFTHKMKDTTQYVRFRLHNNSTDVNIGELTVEFIPSHAGGLCLDGVNDFGKVTGMPIYKDYTLIVDREIESINGSLLSKAQLADNGAFIFEYYRLEQDSTVSFGYLNSPISNLSRNRKISYQSKYSYNGVSLSAGTITDSTTMYLGTIREGATSFSKSAIYSLMSFPYSMSEFLIERQLKKYKLGTLYKDMVEFRPIVKSNVLLDAKPTFVIRGTSTYLNAGDYVPENSQIWVSIKMNNIADRITKFTVNGKTIDIPENAYSEVTLQYGFPFVIDKSPQKIGITIEQDENYVQWNPVVESNAEYKVVDCYIDSLPAIVGNYYPINSKLRIAVTTKGTVDEVTSLTVNGVSLGTPSVNGNRFTFNGTLSDKSPQNINITIDEYIRYEDIDFTDCYPGVPRIYVNDKSVTWGDKLKVGDEFTFYGNVNILPEMYNVLVKALYNGEEMIYGSIGTISKSMAFTSFKTYIFDDNEPNCILSPRLLRIPNSSYKILGHIPDISGHGNHGVIHNSAYAEGSGVNEDGSYQFDGVDDFVTIPTITGGKQVLMKVNWQKEDTMIYNQNPGEDNFAIFANDYNNNNLVNAYASRNNGSTYIDGILNNNILATQLKNVTHNITITNENVINNTIVPVIGANAAHNNFYAQMSLYDFMLFDNISTDDKIKELNEYVGIEGNT